MGDRHGVCQVADHPYCGIGIDHLQQSTLLQCFSIVQLRGERLKAASLKPHRVIVDLIDDVLGGLSKRLVGALDTMRNQKPLAKRRLSVGRLSFFSSAT